MIDAIINLVAFFFYYTLAMLIFPDRDGFDCIILSFLVLTWLKVTEDD